MSSAEELSALARKYRKLETLRLEHQRTGQVAEREALRALAAEFPGALRELDRLPLDEIERRAHALEAAAQGALVEPWMQWLVAYHALLRAALFVKTESAKGIAIDEELVARASLHARIEIDIAFLRRFAQPSRGRPSRLVLDEVARRFDHPIAAIEGVLVCNRGPHPQGPSPASGEGEPDNR